MLSPEVVSVFVLTSVLLALTPGPDNLYVLSQSLMSGKQAGLMVVLGLCSGLIIHTGLVLLGISALISSSPQALFILKLIGVAYLLYLASTFWRAKKNKSELDSQQLKLKSHHLYLRGFLMNVSNPKVILFFLAFLPQFITQSAVDVEWQIIQLGFLFLLSTLLVFGGIALLAHGVRERLKNFNMQALLLQRLVSIVFVIIALKLLLEKI